MLRISNEEVARSSKLLHVYFAGSHWLNHPVGRGLNPGHPGYEIGCFRKRYLAITWSVGILVADHSSPSSARDKNERSYAAIPPHICLEGVDRRRRYISFCCSVALLKTVEVSWRYSQLRLNWLGMSPCVRMFRTHGDMSHVNGVDVSKNHSSTRVLVPMSPLLRFCHCPDVFQCLWIVNILRWNQ
jgi:hypothetical protein